MQPVTRENTGFGLTMLSMIMLVGIGGNAEAMPPTAGTAEWMLVFLQAVGATAVGLIGSKMISTNDFIKSRRK